MDFDDSPGSFNLNYEFLCIIVLDVLQIWIFVQPLLKNMYCAMMWNIFQDTNFDTILFKKA